jgi:NADH-quinone oxidoreductase subunit L/multicomponent Na+:H+ antiporter subunit D
VSKYFLLIGTVSGGQLVFTAALLVSGILNIAYFWPVVYAAFFESKGESDDKPLLEHVLGGRFAENELATDGGHSEDEEHADGVHTDGDDTAGGEHDEHGYADDHEGDHGHGHHGDWESRGWFGGESTWFMLAPILFAATGSIVLGVVPDAAVFLRIVRLIVAATTGVSV